MTSIEDIVAPLMHNNGSFPRGPLKLAIEQREVVIPRLLQEVEYAINNIEAIDATPKYIFHIYALYLLAQFRETKAYPLIIDFFSIPGDLPLHVTGDVVTEDLGRILASTFDGDLKPLKKLIEDTNVSEYTRSAALRAMCVLWGKEILSRQQIIEYFQFLMSDKYVGDDSGIWNTLVARSIVLSPNELTEDINKAFEQGLVETFYVNQSDVERNLGLSDEKARISFSRESRSNFIDDTISEMEYWACFKSKTKSVGLNPKSKQIKVGRNDPCPCDSGKKHKKCCLLAE